MTKILKCSLVFSFYNRFSFVLKRARQELLRRSRMKTFQKTVHGKQFYMAEWEGSSERTILGIHGLTGNYAHMMALAESLTPQFRMLAFDVRGRGESGPAENPSCLMNHAKDAAEIIDALDLKNVLIVGHSMGGYIGAMVSGLSDKVKGVVLLDGAGMVTRQECELLTPALSRLDKIFPSAEAYEEGVKPTYKLMGLEWNKYIQAGVRHEIGLWTPDKGGDGVQYKYKGDSARIREDLFSCVDYNHAEVFGAARCPFLLVYASGNMGGGKPLYQESAYDIVKKLVPALDYYKSPSNHYTLALETQPVLNSRIEAFAKNCGL